MYRQVQAPVRIPIGEQLSIYFRRRHPQFAQYGFVALSGKKERPVNSLDVGSLIIEGGQLIGEGQFPYPGIKTVAAEYVLPQMCQRGDPGTAPRIHFGRSCQRSHKESWRRLQFIYRGGKRIYPATVSGKNKGRQAKSPHHNFLMIGS